MTIGLLLLFAIIGGLISAKFKQPVVLGLLIIGMIIGPNTLNLVNDAGMIDLMIEFGAIIFLFVIGLEFSLKKLMKSGFKMILVTLFKVGIMFFIGFTTTVVLGLGVIAAVFVGVLMSFSSTVIILNILKQKNLVKRPEVPLLVGVLVLEDIFGVVALTFFSSMRASGSAGLLSGLEDIVISLSILVFIYIIVSKFAERIVSWITKSAGDEMIMFISLGICAAFASLSYFLGISPSAGAFLAGSIVSNFEESKKFESSIKSHTLMFTSFLFISVGTLIDLSAIKEHIMTIIVFLVVIILGLFVAVGMVTRVFGNFSFQGSIFSTMAMLPLGVFSILVAKESMKFNIGIDLVSVTSVLIFTLTVIMALLLKYNQSLYDTSFKNRYTGFQKVLGSFSDYIKSLLEEIDVENASSRILKKKAHKLMGYALLSVFIIVFTGKISGLVKVTILKYFIIFAGVVGVFLTALMMRRYSKEVFHQIIKILSNMSGGEKIRQTKLVVKSMMKGLFFVLIGIFSPLVIFVLNASGYYLFASTTLIIIGLLFFHSTYKHLKNVSYDYKYNIKAYKKLDMTFLKVKQ